LLFHRPAYLPIDVMTPRRLKVRSARRGAISSPRMGFKRSPPHDKDGRVARQPGQTESGHAKSPIGYSYVRYVSTLSFVVVVNLNLTIPAPTVARLSSSSASSVLPSGVVVVK
jgi:hypothetical protein